MATTLAHVLEERRLDRQGPIVAAFRSSDRIRDLFEQGRLQRELALGARIAPTRRRPTDVAPGMRVARYGCMGIGRQLSQYANRRMTRRLYRAAPWIGSILALATLGRAVRRKGFLGGTADTALDFIPFVGGAKNLAEAGRGRDFIPDRPSRA